MSRFIRYISFIHKRFYPPQKVFSCNHVSQISSVQTTTLRKLGASSKQPSRRMGERPWPTSDHLEKYLSYSADSKYVTNQNASLSLFVYEVQHTDAFDVCAPVAMIVTFPVRLANAEFSLKNEHNWEIDTKNNQNIPPKCQMSNQNKIKTHQNFL